MKGKNNSIGITGEFLVAGKLSSMGWAVAPTLKNTPGIDILVSDGLSAKAVQVKTTKGPKADWPCSPPQKTSKDLVYVFVVLNSKPNNTPEFYIVPSADVQKIIMAIDAAVAKNNVKKGKPERAKGVWKFWFETEEEAKRYKDKWNNFGLKDLSNE